MYESFFGLIERPFTLRPDPHFLYLSSKHKLALSMLEYGLTGQAGFVVVTGDIGAGKTTLIRHFLSRADHMSILGVISNTHVAFGDILQWVFQALNIETEATNKAERYKVFTKYIELQYNRGHQVVLIVDEAQNLTAGALEELRLLSNIDINGQTLQIILVGQPQLLEKLKQPSLHQFAQRISVHYHLTALTYRETCTYIKHRLAVAGAQRAIFDSLAMAAVYYFTAGVPRTINSICDMALVYAFAEGRRIIDVDTILAVALDREKSGVQTLARQASTVTREILQQESEQEFGEGEEAAPAEPVYVDQPEYAAPQYYDGEAEYGDAACVGDAMPDNIPEDVPEKAVEGAYASVPARRAKEYPSQQEGLTPAFARADSYSYLRGAGDGAAAIPSFARGNTMTDLESKKMFDPFVWLRWVL
ncbi:ExeA family protein [Dongia soli]|uniref:AAA family ATPase n=1 Tax=Dongia soli TaxID=600628 RepID=A0ABU5EHL5_9PROT|nr:AAA family ATPase [Dongia soli]MDY0885645.1 AAA family ATPase [Dongia soli]